ncbi:MAG: hypothetical protein WBE34_03320 [Candidatus Nitrosopolaris sp.]
MKSIKQNQIRITTAVPHCVPRGRTVITGGLLTAIALAGLIFISQNVEKVMAAETTKAATANSKSTSKNMPINFTLNLGNPFWIEKDA